jgi:glycosyltransferase involved in cell wall biosynthesis
MGVAAARFLQPDPSAPPIDVRVVVPARDEVDNVAACVHACRRQATEVVVVDDASSDGTGVVAEAAGARVVRLDADPPPGWTGKARACLAGADGATTEWLAFVDADVVLHPSALATMAAATAHTSTSIVGGLRCRTFWERLLLPELGFALVQAGLPPDFASGQCFLVRRDHYEAVGGHGHPSVRGSPVEDRDLARALGGHDPRLAPRLLDTRMYRDAAELRAGLLKNQAALHPRPAVHLAALLTPIATRRPWAAMAVSAAGRFGARQNPLYGALAPLARVALAGIYLESRWRARSGRPVTWKGREVTPGAAG